MSKRKKFMDLKLSGTLEIIVPKSSTNPRDDAIRQVRDRIMHEIMTEHPTFEKSGLPPMWEEWLDSEVEKLVGIEVTRVDKPVEEWVNARWSNEEGVTIEQDTRRRVKKGGKKTGGRWKP